MTAFWIALAINVAPLVLFAIAYGLYFLMGWAFDLGDKLKR